MIMAQQVLEGTWEEIAAHAEELSGKRIKVIVETDVGATVLMPNRKMLDAMQAADEIQQGMNPKPESDGVAILREGRRGAMYGHDPAD